MGYQRKPSKAPVLEAAYDWLEEQDALMYEGIIEDTNKIIRLNKEE